MPSQPDLDGSRVHASRRGARSAPSLAPVRQQPSSSLAQSLFVSKLHGALKPPTPAEVTPEVDALLGKGSGDLDSTGAKAHAGGGRRGYTKAEVEEIRARINALIDAYEALELEEGEEGEEGAAATDVEGLKDAVGTMVMDFKKKATARTSTLQAAHAGLVKADAGDALARDGDRTPEEIMELAKVIGEVVEIASGQKGRLKQVHDLEVTMLRDFAEDLPARTTGPSRCGATARASAPFRRTMTGSGRWRCCRAERASSVPRTTTPRSCGRSTALSSAPLW